MVVGILGRRRVAGSRVRKFDSFLEVYFFFSMLIFPINKSNVQVVSCKSTSWKFYKSMKKIESKKTLDVFAFCCLEKNLELNSIDLIPDWLTEIICESSKPPLVAGGIGGVKGKTVIFNFFGLPVLPGQGYLFLDHQI